jgi:roadblock/LC7 domain-containing protein
MQIVEQPHRDGFSRWVHREGGMVMATTLKDLLVIDGVVASFEFGADGSLVDYASTIDMPQSLATMTTQFSSSVTQMFNTLSEAFSKISWMEWSPQHGWAYSGGKYTVVVGGNRGVFAQTEEADLNGLFAVLSGSR